MLCVQRPRSKEIHNGWPEQGRAVVNEIGFLTPTREIEIVSPAVVRKGNAMQVKFGHQHTKQTGEDEQTSSQGQSALRKRGCEDQSKRQ